MRNFLFIVSLQLLALTAFSQQRLSSPRAKNYRAQKNLRQVEKLPQKLKVSTHSTLVAANRKWITKPLARKRARQHHQTQQRKKRRRASSFPSIKVRR